MIEQQIQRMIVTAEILFRRNQLVNRLVAVTTETNRFVHLLPREVFPEPLVAVAGARNQMVLGSALPGEATTEFAGPGHEEVRGEN